MDITEKRIAGFKPRFESGSSPIEVAKVILKALIKKSSIRIKIYGRDDAFKLMEIRKNKSDKEFRKLVMEGVLK
jgi:hypothetical protein